MTVKHRGMIAEQAENHCVMIFDENGNFAMHCTFDRPKVGAMKKARLIPNDR